MHQDLLFKDLYVVEPGIVCRGHFEEFNWFEQSTVLEELIFLQGKTQ